MYTLGLTIAIGGQYYRWNDALQSGFWPVVGTLFFNGLGYICVICCMSEMSSTLPFSGGIYGFVRAFLGPYSGYVASRFEIVLDVCYAASAVVFLGSFTDDAGLSHHTIEPAWWCLMFAVAMIISLIGGKVFWTFNKLLAFTATVMLLIYILGSFASVDYTTYADGDATVEGKEVVRQVHHTSGMFLGLQYLPLMSGMCKDPKGDVPKGMFYAMCTLFVTALGVIFTVSTQAPGTYTVAEEHFPLTSGFAKIFHISYQQALWLSFPGVYANFFGFVWAYGRQMSAMAKSGLLPDIFTWMSPWTDTPYIACIAGTIVSFLLALCAHFEVFGHLFEDQLMQIYVLASYFVYILLFLSYFYFKEKYSSLTRSFYSPLGIYGAGIGIAIFSINSIAIIAFECGQEQLPLIVLTIVMILATVYYFLILHGNQHFSEEEKEKLFKAYLINANSKTRQAVKKRGGSRTASGAAQNNSNKKSALLTASSNKAAGNSSSQQPGSFSEKVDPESRSLGGESLHQQPSSNHCSSMQSTSEIRDSEQAVAQPQTSTTATGIIGFSFLSKVTGMSMHQVAPSPRTARNIPVTTTTTTTTVQQKEDGRIGGVERVVVAYPSTTGYSMRSMKQNAVVPQQQQQPQEQQQPEEIPSSNTIQSMQPMQPHDGTQATVAVQEDEIHHHEKQQKLQPQQQSQEQSMQGIE